MMSEGSPPVYSAERVVTSEGSPPDILQHLLEIEGKAAVLVDDAQAEADRRIKETEEKNRLAFEEAYQNLTGKLEAEYQKTMDSVKLEYNKYLDEFRADLDCMPKQSGRFSALVHSLLVEEK